MDRIAELLCGRCVGIIPTKFLVVRLVSVSSPIPFELTSISIDHHHAFVQIAVGYVGFVGFRINKNLGHSTEVLKVIAAPVLACVAILREEFAILRELQDLSIVCSVSSDPDVTLMIDSNSVI